MMSTLIMMVLLCTTPLVPWPSFCTLWQWRPWSSVAAELPSLPTMLSMVVQLILLMLV